VTKKRRLLLAYSLFAVASLVACAGIAVALLPGEREPPKEGLALGITDAYAGGVPRDAPGLRFTRVPIDFRHFPGARTRVLPEDMGSGVAVEDFDGDGLPDLFFANLGPVSAPAPPLRLYINRGGCAFADSKLELPSLHAMGVAAADYDGDGDFDVYVTGYGRNLLLRNDGDLRFTDVTDEAGVGGGGFSAGACWGDADGDGDLDLYVCRYVAFDGGDASASSSRGAHSLPVTLNPSAYPPVSNLLYLNEGGRFREAAQAMGVANPTGKSLQAVFADFDGDGVQDLYVANDVSDNAMYRGRRGQPFEDATHLSCTADWRGAMGLAVGDPDLDGDLDLFVTHWVSEENTLYLKEDGDFLFRDAAMETYLGPPSRAMVAWACDFADLDRDGRPDLFVVNGSTFEEPGAPALLSPMPLQLFWNGRKRFTDLAPWAGDAFLAPLVGRGGVAGDLDLDGDVDLVVVAHGSEALVLRNDTETPNRELVVEPRSAVPNVFAYGAWVTVECNGKRQSQQVGTKVSYLSSGPHALHFGLGTAAAADRVIVRFPSGKTVERRCVPAGTRLVVKEHDPRALGPLMDTARDAGPEEAVRIYREVLRLDPDHANALYNLAQLVEPGEATALCKRLLALEPMLPRGHLLRAALLSDPRRMELMDLDAALAEVKNAQRLNRDETGARVEEGRILLLRGEVLEAARVFERVAPNPRAAALAALCYARAGDMPNATRLLGHRPGKPPVDVTEEGDTDARRSGEEDLVARLLDLGESDAWTLTRLPLPPADGAECALVDVDGDGTLDARVGAAVVFLPSMRVGACEPRAPAPLPRIAPYRFEDAARFALAPPPRVKGPPPGTTATCEADLDGDGDLDLVAACGGDDPCAPLPWWALLREGDAYRPVRGSMPEPGFRVAAVAAGDIDGDGRAEILLKGGGLLPRDSGTTWLASLR
jgi:hypothetical protein